MGEVIMVDMRVRISAPGMSSPYNGKTGTVRSVAGGGCQVKLDDGRRIGIASKCCVPLVTIPMPLRETGSTEWSEQQPEPKTERKVVIAFLDVQEGASENVIITTMSEDGEGWVMNHDAKTSDADRLRYGAPEKGDVICDVRGKKLRPTTIAYEPAALRLIIDPPTPDPEPETVEEVIENTPIILDSSEIKTVTDAKDYLNFLQAFGKRLIKAAQEREENK